MEIIVQCGDFFILFIVAGCIVVVVLFQVKFGFKKYDIILASRFNQGSSYGIQYVSSLELWKIDKKQDDSLSIRRLYPF